MQLYFFFEETATEIANGNLNFNYSDISRTNQLPDFPNRLFHNNPQLIIQFFLYYTLLQLTVSYQKIGCRAPYLAPQLKTLMKERKAGKLKY